MCVCVPKVTFGDVPLPFDEKTVTTTKIIVLHVSSFYYIVANMKTFFTYGLTPLYTTFVDVVR